MGASVEQSSAADRIFLYFSDAETAHLLERSILRPAGYEVVQLSALADLERLAGEGPPVLLILEETVLDGGGLERAEWVMSRYPRIPVILYSRAFSDRLAIAALRWGLVDYLVAPLKATGVLESVQRALQRSHSQPSFPSDQAESIAPSAGSSADMIEISHVSSPSEPGRDKLEAILDGIAVGLIAVDGEDRLIVINQAARSFFGIENGSLVGKPLSKVIHHSDLLGLLSQENREGSYRTEITLEDGRVLSAQSSPISGVGLAIIMQDITYLKNLDRVKSDFVNTVSHDLRSPLTAILGYIELLERVGPVTDKQLDFIHRIQASVYSITDLIDDLLDLGRIEAGFDTMKERVPLPPIIHYTVDGLRGRILDKQQVLELDVPSDLPAIHGNPIRLRQMLSNLIGNAVKYTPEGGRIWVRARAEGGQILLQVLDTGPGIPPAEQPYIFNKFYRGSNVPEEASGSGLGLAIVKSITEDHQGRIWVDSTPGLGTTFTVVLPIPPGDEGRPKSSRKKEKTTR